MAKGSFGDTAINALGYPLGIANLVLAARGGNLYNQLIARNQALQDPAQRQALVGAPGSAGMMLVSGGQPPNPLTPEYSLEGVPPGSFFPNLPPISPAEWKERNARYQVPLTPQEAVSRAADLVYYAKGQGLPQQGFSNMGISPGGNPFITTQLPYGAEIPPGTYRGLSGKGEDIPWWKEQKREEARWQGIMGAPPPPGARVPARAPSGAPKAEAAPTSPYQAQYLPPPGVNLDEYGNPYAADDLPFEPGSGRVDSKGRLILGQEVQPGAGIPPTTTTTTTPPTTTTQPPAEFDTSVLDPTQPIPLPDQIFGPTPATPVEIPATPATPSSEIGYPPPQTYGAPIDFGRRQLRAPSPIAPPPPNGLVFPQFPASEQGRGEMLPGGGIVPPGVVFNLPTQPVQSTDVGGNISKPIYGDLDVDTSPKSLATTIMIGNGWDPRNARHRMNAQQAVANMLLNQEVAKKAATEGAGGLTEDQTKAVQMIFVANESIIRLQQMHPSLVNKWVGPFQFPITKGRYITPQVGMFSGMSDDEARYFASFSADLNALMPIGWSIAGANFTEPEMAILKSLMPTGNGERNAQIFTDRANKYQQQLAMIAKTKLEAYGPKLSPWLRQSLQDVIDGRSLFEPTPQTP